LTVIVPVAVMASTCYRRGMVWLISNDVQVGILKGIGVGLDPPRRVDKKRCLGVGCPPLGRAHLPIEAAADVGASRTVTAASHMLREPEVDSKRPCPRSWKTSRSGEPG
jgi:hypothetical protein